jgi:hypothetical protein
MFAKGQIGTDFKYSLYAKIENILTIYNPYVLSSLNKLLSKAIVVSLSILLIKYGATAVHPVVPRFENNPASPLYSVNKLTVLLSNNIMIEDKDYDYYIQKGYSFAKNELDCVNLIDLTYKYNQVLKLTINQVINYYPIYLKYLIEKLTPIMPTIREQIISRIRQSNNEYLLFL